MSNTQGAKNIATLVYALHAASFVTGGFTLLVAIIISYVKRDIAWHLGR